MSHTITIGADVRCDDGKIGSVGGVVINPNRSEVDYVIMNPGLLGGREYYVPRGGSSAPTAARSRCRAARPSSTTCRGRPSRQRRGRSRTT